MKFIKGCNRTTTIADVTTTMEFSFKPTIDKENGKIGIELIAGVTSSVLGNIGEQYANLDIDYDFENKTVTSFRFCSANTKDVFIWIWQ